MTEIQTTHYSRYHVRPGRWQALRHALTGRGFELDGHRVSPVVKVPPGTGRATVAVWDAAGGSGGKLRVAEIDGAGQEPARSGPGRHRRGPARRICCETLDGQPHADCPVYTPGGYARPEAANPGSLRDCCPTAPGSRHAAAVCTLNIGQRAALADHEMLGRPYEKRLDVKPSGQPWHCASCGAGIALIGGRLVHSDPLCNGPTQQQVTAAARPNADGRIMP